MKAKKRQYLVTGDRRLLVDIYCAVDMYHGWNMRVLYTQQMHRYFKNAYRLDIFESYDYHGRAARGENES